MQPEKHPMEDEKLATLLRGKFVDIVLKEFNRMHSTLTTIARVPKRSFPVTSETFPRLYDLYTETMSKFSIKDEIPLYIEEDYNIRHNTLGTDGKCVILMSSACVECLSDEELMAAFGYECGHVVFKHIRYLNAFDALDDISSLLPKIARAGIEGVKVLFLEWRQYAEYSADRAALYAASSKDAVIGLLLKKLGAVNSVVDYTFDDATAEESEVLDVTSLNLVGKIALQSMYSKASDPFAMLRIRELLKQN